LHGDYNYAYQKNWTFKTGLRYQGTHTDNQINYNTIAGDSTINDAAYSSHTKLDEDIEAFYITGSKKWKWNSLTAGLRIENSSASSTAILDQHYFDLFPNVNFTHTYADNDQFTFTYKRTISRPPYQEVLPYTIFVDQYTIFEGNPYLTPRFDHIFTLNQNIKTLDISLTYTLTDKAFYQFPIDQDLSTFTTYYSFININNSSQLALDLYYPLKIAPWWNTSNSADFKYADANGIVLNAPTSLTTNSFNVKTNQVFTLSESMKFQFDYYYQSAYSAALIKIKSYNNADAALLIDVLQKRGHISINGIELLGRNKYGSYQQFGFYSRNGTTFSDGQRIGIGFNYTFGNSKI